MSESKPTLLQYEEVILLNIGYIRVSTEEQARHGLSLAEQQERLTNYARDQHYAVVDTYIDEGATARKSLKNRSQFQRLMVDVRADRIDIIVFIKLDRWFRNVHDYYMVQDVLDQHRVEWECTDEDYNTTTANGRLHLNIILSISQDESDRASDRIKFVFEGKKRRHEILSGKLPPGLMLKDRHAVIDERVAPLIRKIFNHMYSGGSIRSALAYNDEAVALGILPLNHLKLVRWLHNPIYTGELYGIPDYLPAIIPADVFQRVQELMRTRSRTPTHNRIYLFSGIFHCPHCGQVMSGNSSRTYKVRPGHIYSYRCSNYINNRGIGCDFSREILETKIERYLIKHLSELVAGHISCIEHERIEQLKKCPSITLESISAKLERLKDLYLDELIDKEMYRKEFAKLREQQATLSAPVAPLPAVSPALQQIVGTDDFTAVYGSLTRENKRRFWRSILRNITFVDTPATRGRAEIPFIVEFL